MRPQLTRDRLENHQPFSPDVAALADMVAASAGAAVIEGCLGYIQAPVIAQDAPWLERNLPELATQAEADKLLLVVSSNSTDPDDPGFTTIRRTVSEYKQAKPQAPIGLFERTYTDQQGVGLVLRDLSDVDVELARRKTGPLPHDLSQLRFDIDATRVAKNWVSKLHGAVTDPQSSIVFASGNVSFERSGGALPRLDTLGAWFDLNQRINQKMSIAYNAAALAAYLETPGYNPQSSFGEVGPILNNIVSYGSLAYLKQAEVVTSTRHSNDLFRQFGIPFGNVGCGNKGYRDLGQSFGDDITEAELERHVTLPMEHAIGSVRNRSYNRYMFDNNLRHSSPQDRAEASKHAEIVAYGFGRTAAAILGGSAILPSVITPPAK